MISKEPVLITGGAGYVGSHAGLAFLEAGYPVVVLDDLSAGLRDTVPGAAVFVEGDAGALDTVATVVARYRIGAVVHFAARTSVPESVRAPLRYYRGNSAASANLIPACVAGGVRRFVFSSSAAVYGAPRTHLVAEDTPTAPINPYGRSKLMTEWMLRDAAAAHDLRYVALRYFNVAGADPEGRTGQSSRGAANLLKMACEAAVGRRTRVTVFGTDYATPDGTGVQRLHSRHRPRRDPRRGVARPGGRQRRPGAQLRLRPWVLGARGAADGTGGERCVLRGPRGTAAGRRPAGPGGRHVPDARDTGVVAA